MLQSTIKHITKILLALFIFVLGSFQHSKAQNIKLLAGNTFNGAMNGVILGGATMALKNSDDFEPVRIGLGLGTLAGLGVGVYDITQTSAGQQFYLSGTFNDATNTSIIVLLDTFYGAAAGAVIATSVTLINKDPILDGLQYGSGVGAWVGFGFGIFDAFVLAKRPGELQAVKSNPNAVNGFITIQNKSSSIQAGFLSPGYTTFTSISNQSIELRHSLNLELLNLKIGL